MVLKISNKLTPGTRHSVKYKNINLTNYKKKIFYNKFYSSLKSFTGNKTIRRRIKFKKIISLKKNKILNKLFTCIFVDLLPNSLRRLKIGRFKNIYNLEYFAFTNTFQYPGFINFNFLYLYNSTHPRKLIGHTLPLKFIPINTLISSVFNTTNKKPTFSRSFGSSSIRLKNIKKSKLVLLKLPSSNLKFFPNDTFSCFGELSGLTNKKLIEGKWGYSLKFFKKINVRGVAKNPVDHPNGGRTKAKQPELSPWGWVSKKGK